MFSHGTEVEHEEDEDEEKVEETEKEEDFDEDQIFQRGAGGSAREGRTMTRRNMDRNIKRLRDLSISCVN